MITLNVFNVVLWALATWGAFDLLLRILLRIPPTTGIDALVKRWRRR